MTREEIHPLRYICFLLGVLLLTGCGSTTASTPTPAATMSAVAERTVEPAGPTSTSTPTATPSPTPTLAPPTATPAPGETAPPTPTATAPPPSPTPTATLAPGRQVNEIPVDSFVVLPPAVQTHVAAIAARGRELGRNPHRFSKLGDSTTLKPPFLGFFDRGEYVLGPYDYLQPTIDHFQGSFDRVGVAARVGLHAWSVFDPLWANKEWCEPNEDMLACEIRLNNPGLLWVRLGSNDAGVPSSFRLNLEKVVEYGLEQGVIPILVTKADRYEGPDNVNNEIIRQVAAAYAVPLWEFDRVAESLPGRGLDEDGVHLVPRTIPHDYTNPETFTSGHAVLDLTALIALHEIRQAMEE
jgi:hypothetical protein